MIEEAHGNLLDAKADALINTVNTVGVMGKGIALQFKQAFPENYKAYKRACNQGAVQLGHMFIWDAGALASDGPRYIINFPTKQHWRSNSKLSDIHAGLDDLVRQLTDLSIRSVAIPPLGCGNGGLRWEHVRPAIERALEQVPDVHVLLYPPQGAPAAGPAAGGGELIMASSPYELDEAHAEIARHHRDFLRIRTILDHYDAHPSDPAAALRQIRNIVG